MEMGDRETIPLTGGSGPYRKGLLSPACVLVSVIFTGLVTLALVIGLSVVAVHQTNKLGVVCNGGAYAAKYTPYYKLAQYNQPETNLIFRNTLLKNGTIWDGTGTVYNNYDIFIVNGTISAIGLNLAGDNITDTWELNGRYVTPGLVDAHSHLGVYSFPEDAHATQDGNELSQPATPMVRAVDALNPLDPAIDWILAGGVTTSLVLPGSGNVIGGEAAYVKLKSEATTVADMLIPNAPRSLKMACGENPKNVYGGRQQMPYSRMGIGSEFRDQFFAAAQLLQEQRQFNCTSDKSKAASTPPADLDVQTVTDVLAGQVLLQVHCYTVMDMEMMIRTSQEFGFQIGAFHHALEAWKIADLLASLNISVATFTDMWGFKMEAYEGSVEGPGILAHAGVNVALKSDHPVIFARYLMDEAARAAHWGSNYDFGMTEQQALISVTSAPAKMIGLGNRVGTIAPGFDGDIVVWDRYPLAVGAQPWLVFIEGYIEIDNSAGEPNLIPDPIPADATLTDQGPTSCESVPSPIIAVTGAVIWTGVAGQNYTNGTVVIEDGQVTCVGVAADCPIPDNADIYIINGGVILPGLISVGAPLGQAEVDQEPDTQDGYVAGPNNANILASDFINYNNYQARKMSSAFLGGVTAAIVGPQGNALVAGQGVSFWTQGTTIIDGLIKDQIGVFLNIGNGAKAGGATNSISGQMSLLRQLLSAPNDTATAPWSSVLNGSMPLVAFVDQANEIASLIRLKIQYGFQLVIVGGREATLITDLLVANNVPVVLTPPNFHPSTFETWDDVEGAAGILQAAGVLIGLAKSDASEVRNLRWSAGRAVARGLPYEAALQAVTSNIAQIFNLDGPGTIEVGTAGNVVAYSGDPLSYESQVLLVVQGQSATCFPLQY